MDLQLEEDGGMNIQAKDNTLMEEDYNFLEDMIEEDGIGVDDEDSLDIPILEKAYEPLYQSSQTTLFYTIVLLVNLKFMNDLSKVEMSCMLRCVNFFIFNVNILLLFIILAIHICCCRLIGEF